MLYTVSEHPEKHCKRSVYFGPDITQQTSGSKVVPITKEKAGITNIN